MISLMIVKHLNKIGKSKRWLSDISGVDYDGVLRYLSGQTDSKVSNVEKMIKALNLNIEIK